MRHFLLTYRLAHFSQPSDSVLSDIWFRAKKTFILPEI